MVNIISTLVPRAKSEKETKNSGSAGETEGPARLKLPF